MSNLTSDIRDGRSKIQNEKGIIHIDWGGALAIVWWQEECG